MSKPAWEVMRVLQETDLLFPIGSVAEITHVSEATLRAWERRYSFPQAVRSAGRHRLYSQQMVIQLQWVKLRLEEGMRASQAIAALHQVPRAAAVATTFQMALPLSSSLRVDSSQAAELASEQRRLYELLLAYDSTGATTLLEEAPRRYPKETVILEMIRPTLSAIGDAWRAGDVDITTEHFATNFLRHHLLSMMRASPPAYRVSPVVLGCAPGELHEGSLLILGAVLRQRRWPVVYLGQLLPLSDLATVARTVEPALIVFVAMSEETALALMGWPHWLPQEPENANHRKPGQSAPQLPLVGYGGRAFTENPLLAEQIPGILLGQTLDEGYARIHRLLLDLNALNAEGD